MINFLNGILTILNFLTYGVTELSNKLKSPFRWGSMEERLFTYYSNIEHHPNYFSADTVSWAMYYLDIPETEENLELADSILELVADIQGVYVR